MAVPLLGWVAPQDRTQAQQDEHDATIQAMPKFAIAGAPIKLAKGEKIILGAMWADPRVVADVGLTFNRFHQLTGSCVGASTGNMIFTLAAVQRCINQTKAVLPWWMYNYGRGRSVGGMNGQGEGGIDSAAIKQLVSEGIIDYAAHSTLPRFKTDDGLYLTSAIEMQYSNGGAAVNTSLVGEGKVHPLGTAAVANNPQDIYQGIVNGYPTLYGCDDYVGHGSIAGSGDAAYVRGRYDGRGGHSTGFHGIWEHPNDGPLYLYQNNWPVSTYPKDPAGGTDCSVWLPESEVAKIWSQLSGKGETFVLSHLNWFPSQSDEILNWIP